MEEKMSDYNGWTNYETWNVALWLGNEPGTYEDVREMTRVAIRTHGKECEYHLAEDLKGYVEELMPPLGASMAADLLGAALCEVNWQEIAESYIEDFGDEE
jgi:hypothetical protein